LIAHGQLKSPGTPASSTTKTDRHDIVEIFLKVALNTKIQIQINYQKYFIHDLITLLNIIRSYNYNVVQSLIKSRSPPCYLISDIYEVYISNKTIQIISTSMLILNNKISLFYRV
jgi:hypothetical protein